MKKLSSIPYVVIKVFNNNVLFVSQDKNEKILFGKGIGFGKHTGDEIPDSIKVDKIFKIEDMSNNHTFNQLINKLDNGFIGLCEEVIYMISNEFDKELNEKIHISLIDHIACAIRRIKGNDYIENPFLAETEVIYKKEFEVSRKAVKILEDKLRISIPDDEIGFIALHIHSAINEGKLSSTLMYTFLSSTIVEFIENNLNIKIDKQSIDYARFLTHIRYAIERILSGTSIKNELLDVIRKQYPDSYKLAEKVAKIIEKEIHMQVLDDEVACLTIHIQRFSTAEFI